MGTRGTWGFVLDGEEKLAYNHYDSYPGGLGTDLVAWLREQNLDEVRERVRALRLVDEGEPPTAEEVERAKALGLHDGSVSTGMTQEWYSLLRNAQGNPELTLAMGRMEDGHGFPLDSLFCEWAYVIDLDAERLEVYKGFQQAAHTSGRFAERSLGREGAGGTEWFPVAQIAQYDLHSLPEPGAFEAEVERLAGDEEVEA